MKASSVLETALYVADLDQAAQFYSRVLGLRQFAAVEVRHVFFRAGNGVFLLFNPDATEIADEGLGVPAHGARGPGHAAFEMAENEVDWWRAHLRGEGVPIEKELRWPNGGLSLYFRDPDGNSLELVTRRTWGLAAD